MGDGEEGHIDTKTRPFAVPTEIYFVQSELETRETGGFSNKWWQSVPTINLLFIGLCVDRHYRMGEYLSLSFRYLMFAAAAPAFFDATWVSGHSVQQTQQFLDICPRQSSGDVEKMMAPLCLRGWTVRSKNIYTLPRHRNGDQSVALNPSPSIIQ